MKSTEIVITNQGSGMEEALNAVEAFAASTHLNGKSAIRFRLLAEETISLMTSITGEVEADFWLENDENTGVYSIHLETLTKMTAEKRKALLSVSSTGENVSTRGFMGKIQGIFERFMESYANEGIPEYYTSGLILAQSGSPTASEEADPNANAIIWSMNQYKSSLLHKKDKSSSALEEWDALEKSILANAADEVKVGIRSGRVELTISKKFS